jgi:hypothetical protein
MTKTFYLRHSEARRLCAEFVLKIAPHGCRVRCDEPAKKREQEDKYHAMIGDIANQIEHLGRRWDADDMKRLLIDEFAEEMRLVGTPLHHDGRVIPSLDGRRIVQLGIQSRDFYVNEASQFIEYLYKVGAERDVVWSESNVGVERRPPFGRPFRTKG